jgi:hypothetical protein
MWNVPGAKRRKFAYPAERSRIERIETFLDPNVQNDEAEVALAEDRDQPGEWRVEYFHSADEYITIFAGPCAEQRASQANRRSFGTDAVQGVRDFMAPAIPVPPSRRLKLAWHTHHAIAEALHIELAHVAFSVCGFGLLPAGQLAAHLFQRRPLPGERRGRQGDERKRQHNRLHFTLQVSARPLERDCGRLSPQLRTVGVKPVT